MEEEEPTEFEPAHGLQVLENLLLAGDMRDTLQFKKMQTELNYLKTTVNSLNEAISLLSNTNQGVVLAALKYELIKITVIGFTEYDNPVEKNYLNESMIALKSIQANLKLFDSQIPSSLIVKTDNLFSKTISFIKRNNDMEKFNRLEFILNHYPQLSQLIDEYTVALKTVYSSYNACIDINEKSIFDLQSFVFYFNQQKSNKSDARIFLGKTLFFDPILSGNLKRSCASCHKPGKAFTDGRAKSLAFDQQQTVTRNSPTLLNACLQTSFFDDSRELSLERQIKAVVNNPKELNSSFSIIVARLKQSEGYQQLFKQIFPDDSISANQITSVIADYERSLVSFNSNFDKYIRGDKSKLTTSQINGFNLFMGKAKCGSCHFAPLFNGVVPPFYSKSDFEVIGTLASNDFKNPELDADEGIGAVNKTPHQKFGFKVPSLRNATLTAPYMHNGSMKTLQDVLTFYNKGGALGFGIPLSNQTLSGDSLGLNKKQTEDIIHFIESLTDTSGLTAASKSLPRFFNNDKMNLRKIGGEY